jgi:hypothetical protein
MKALGYLVFCVLIVSGLGCDSGLESIIEGVDSQITLEDALTQNYNLQTPLYGIKVAIREDVSLDADTIVNLLDEDAVDFLDCQFERGAAIGFEEFMLDDGTLVPPLSELRVFVVPRNFECDAVDRDVCSGIFYPSSDLIIIAERGIGSCGDLSFWKHELGHRYGMALDHSNQEEFEPCIDPPDCF